jgi:hypothetical protein
MAKVKDALAGSRGDAACALCTGRQEKHQPIIDFFTALTD